MNKKSDSLTRLGQREFERILLIKPSSLGDIVHALPILHGLRTRYPKAKIDWLIATPFAPLIEGHPDLNEVIHFDRRGYGAMWKQLSTLRAFKRFLGRLRAKHYDLVLDLQGLFRSGFLSFATGASTRVGFREAREGAWLFYSHALPPLDPNAHAVDRLLRIAGLLGFDDVPVTFDLALTDADRATARHLLREAGIGDGRRWIAVVPGARWETKIWPAERFAAVIDALTGTDGVPCVLLGAPEEKEACLRIALACHSPPADLSGRTSIRNFAAIIGLADLVLCHDSAAMHLAVAQNRPLVCLTGPTNPRRTGPYRRLSDVVKLDIPCSPCYLRRLAQCPHSHRCMRELGVETVLMSIRQHLTSADGQFSRELEQRPA